MRWKSQQEFIATVGRFSAGEFERIRQMTPRARNAFSYIQMHSIEEFAGQLLVLLSNEGPSAWQEPACSVMESGTLVLQTCRDLAVAQRERHSSQHADAILQIGLPTDRTSTRKWYSDLAQTARTLRVAYDRYAYAGEGTVVEHVQGTSRRAQMVLVFFWNPAIASLSTWRSWEPCLLYGGSKPSFGEIRKRKEADS